MRLKTSDYSGVTWGLYRDFPGHKGILTHYLKIMERKMETAIRSQDLGVYYSPGTENQIGKENGKLNRNTGYVAAQGVLHSIEFRRL